MLYASVLAIFWTVPGVLQSQSPVKIHVLGPSKLLLGLTHTGHSLLKTRYRELVAAIGAVFKDVTTETSSLSLLSHGRGRRSWWAQYTSWMWRLGGTSRI